MQSFLRVAPRSQNISAGFRFRLPLFTVSSRVTFSAPLCVSLSALENKTIADCRAALLLEYGIFLVRSKNTLCLGPFRPRQNLFADPVSRQACGDVLTKKKLDAHRNQCRGASFTCLDCMVHFHGSEYRSHTSCISEAQKYQGSLYREKKNSKDKDNTNSQAMIPKSAYVESVIEGDEMNAVAVIDVPPRAPTPPPAPEPAGELPSNVNVFDFLVSDDTPTAPRTAIHAPDESRMLHYSKHRANGDSQVSKSSRTDGPRYLERGFSYGNGPIPPSVDRFDSWHNLGDSQQSSHPSFVTPGPKDQRKGKKETYTTEKSDKKRKRGNVEELDLTSSKRPGSRDEHMADVPSTAIFGSKTLHSGLTGGLSRLITDAEFYNDRIDAGPTPISPIKRSRHEKTTTKDDRDDRRKSSYVSYSTSKVSSNKLNPIDNNKHGGRSRSPERPRNGDNKHHHLVKRRDYSPSSDENPRFIRRQYKAIEYPDRPTSVQPAADNQLVSYRSRAELFMSFITKGPDSERGCSINKALKRYHRERDVRGHEKDDEDKELWRSLRLRRNSRGEIVLFI